METIEDGALDIQCPRCKTMNRLRTESPDPEGRRAHPKSNGRGRILREEKDRAIPLRFRQFRYVYFIKNSWRKRLALKTHPYPKPEAQD